MPKKDPIWAPTAPTVPVTAEQLTSCEHTWGILVPASMKRIYAIHNGGLLACCDYPDQLLPITNTRDAVLSVRPLTTWPHHSNLGDPESLSLVREEIGDPALVLPVWTDGHCCFALNYNARGALAEPTVLFIDFESGDWETKADSFAMWLDSLRVRDDVPIVDWNERDTCEVIARSSTTPRLTDAETTEQDLCKTSTGFVLFTRTRRGPRQRLERVEIIGPLSETEAGILDGPGDTYWLQLQPADGRSINWIVSEETKKGRWKSERTSGVPIYCTFASSDISALYDLRTRLLGREVHDRLRREDPVVATESATQASKKAQDDAYEAALQAMYAQNIQMPKLGDDWLQVLQGIIDKLKSIPGPLQETLLTEELPHDVTEYWETFDAYSKASGALSPAVASLVYMRRSQCEMSLEAELKRVKKESKELHVRVRAVVGPINMAATYGMKAGRKT